VTDQSDYNSDMPIKKFFLLLVALWFLVGLNSKVEAQEFGRINSIIAEGVSYHVFAQPGEATVQVLVLGSVSSPGIYEIGISVDLGQLLALSGGPPLTETTGTTSSTTETTVRLFRETTGRRDLVYEAPLQLLLSEPDLYPALHDGDVFTIESIIHQRQRIGFREVISVASSLATLVLVYDRVTRGR